MLIAKELNIIPILEKLLEYKRSWTKHVNRMPRNRLPRVMKLLPNWQKESWKTLKETSGYVQPAGQQVAQLHERYMMMLMMMLVSWIQI